MSGVLTGVRVVEASTLVFVPSAAAVLADWGADVIKIEHPVHGDLARGTRVHGIPTDGWGDGFHVMWESPNRGKRSIGLDLSTDAGRAVLDELLTSADVFLTNFLPPAREKLRLRPDDVRAVNPRLIYGLGNGYGTTGPLAGRGGYDLVCFWNRAGIAFEVAQPDGERPAPLPGPGFGDATSGMMLAGGIAAALFKRASTGEPSTVDVSLLAAGMWSHQLSISGADLLNAPHLPHPSREQTHNPLILTYRTSDNRHIALSMTRPDLFWARFCEAIGHPELIDDPRLADMHARGENSVYCVQLLDEIFGGRPLAHWRVALATQPGAWDVVQTPQEVLTDEQAVANGFVQQVDYGAGRTMRMVTSPVHFDGAPPQLRAAPEMGANTEEILLELGRGWEEISELKRLGIIN
jgi:crotonobetainyl-CoA:carnitine CoA-transferase CaiB-like acyl-CoA transferase